MHARHLGTCSRRRPGRAALVTGWILAAGVTPAPAQDAPPSEELGEIHRLINQHRTAAGCAALSWHRPAARVAETHSRDMALKDYIDHVAPDGTDPGERLLAAGITWHGLIAENIAQTPAGAASAVELWLGSPPHRENIERCEFTHHGVGVFRDLWTEVLVQDPG